MPSSSNCTCVSLDLYLRCISLMTGASVIGDANVLVVYMHKDELCQSNYITRKSFEHVKEKNIAVFICNKDEITL